MLPVHQGNASMIVALSFGRDKRVKRRKEDQAHLSYPRVDQQSQEEGIMSAYFFPPCWQESPGASSILAVPQSQGLEPFEASPGP
ncbi:MAG TPA: hypothetical protein VFN35_11455 [Ktedonobacteraceae bacterium]|nr:hypothetical protein [Ktedonobacteraceae bacterium]